MLTLLILALDQGEKTYWESQLDYPDHNLIISTLSDLEAIREARSLIDGENTLFVFYANQFGKRLAPLSLPQGKARLQLPGRYTLLEAAIANMLPLASSLQGRVSLFPIDQIVIPEETIQPPTHDLSYFGIGHAIDDPVIWIDESLAACTTFIDGTPPTFLDQVDYKTYHAEAQGAGGGISLPHCSLSHKLTHQLIDSSASDLAQLRKFALEHATVGMTNLGNRSYCWDFSTPSAFFYSLMLLTAYDQEAFAMRRFFDRPATNILGPINLDGCSYLRGCHIGGGEIVDSVLINVHAEEIFAKNSIVIGSHAPEITVIDSLLYGTEEELPIYLSDNMLRHGQFNAPLLASGEANWDRHPPGNPGPYAAFAASSKAVH